MEASGDMHGNLLSATHFPSATASIESPAIITNIGGSTNTFIGIKNQNSSGLSAR